MLLVVPFARYELRHPDPLIDVRMFRSPSLWPVFLTAGLFGVSVLGAQAPLSTFARTDAAVYGYGLGATSFQTSLLIGSYVLSLVVGAMLFPLATRWVTPRIALIGASSLVAVGYLLFLPFHDGYAQVLANMIIAGIGSGALVAALPAAAAAAAPAHQTGVATGLTNSVKTVGGAIASCVFGIALLGAAGEAATGTAGSFAGLRHRLARLRRHRGRRGRAARLRAEARVLRRACRGGRSRRTLSPGRPGGPHDDGCRGADRDPRGAWRAPRSARSTRATSRPTPTRRSSACAWAPCSTSRRRRSTCRSRELEALLEQPTHEVRALACSIMGKSAAHRRTTAERRTELYDLYLRRHDRIDQWDLVDLAARDVVGGYLLERDRAPLARLAASGFWPERRTALVATFAFLKRGEVDDAFALAETLADDPEPLVQKALGWVLRAAGDLDRDRLTAFVERHAATMPRVALRAAIEHYAKDDRTRILAIR